MSEENNESDNNINEEAAAPKMYSEEEVSGLLESKNAVLAEKKALEKSLAEFKSNAEKAKESAMKDNGEFDELKAHYADKLAALENTYKADIQEANNQLLKRDKLEIVNSVVGEFSDSNVGNFMLKQMVEVDGTKQIYKDFAGNIVADNVKDFKTWMNTDESMSHLIRGSKATGGGATGTGAGKPSAPTKNLTGMARLEAYHKQ